MNAQSQKTVANCAELKIHIYECRKEPYLAAAYALVLNLGYGFFCGSLLFLMLGFAVLSGYENNNLRAGKERQPLCRQFNLQKKQND